MIPEETIAALATPPGRGGIGVIRISGAEAPHIAEIMLGRAPRPRHAELAEFRSPEGEVLDQGLALYFPGPHSFTGEHVLELHGHGGMVIMDRLLQCALALGARPARAGEFSERAFLNGKIDLLQAEAIADLIDSASHQAARSALHSLQGDFSRRIEQLGNVLLELRAYVEAGLDFPDEELDLLADGQVIERLEQLQNQLAAIQAQARQGFLLKEGMNLVIAGSPNVGKSSLLNRLVGRDTAIVTAVAGTTRDIVRDSLHLDGMPLHVMDTAGLRDTDDPVEQEGIRRTRAALERADLVLLLSDDREDEPSSASLLDGLPPGLETLSVRNKCDLSGNPAGLTEQGALRISAKTGAGLDLLRHHLKARMGYHGGGESEGTFMARRRHLEALGRATESLDNALVRGRDGGLELVAEELRQCQHALGEMTGQVNSEDLLEKIFSSFCIGK